MLFLSLFFLLAAFHEPALAIKKSYIVYLGGHSHGNDVTDTDLERVTESHTQLLAPFLGSEEKAKDAIFYSYKRHINAFAALLEEEEAAQIGEHPDVVSVFLDKGNKLHTTHSWGFMRLEKRGAIHPSSIWKKARFGEDVIIANVDSGVWPESKSFSGKGFGAIPSKWKGICQLHDKDNNTLCNNKLIGARYYKKGYELAVGHKLNSSYETTRDIMGHGTHTLSTAGGNLVPGASVNGLGNGTAKGGSPKARVAAYKVCWPPVSKADGDSSCFDSDCMQAFEDAITDGVDVLSVSLSGPAVNYFKDGPTIAAFHAVQRGVVVVASAANSGPGPGTVTNVAPWIITVGASAIDREFQANVVLKNGSVLYGTSLSTGLPSDKLYPLISAAHAAASNVSDANAILCKDNTLDLEKVKGKIVVCLGGDNDPLLKGVECLRAGAVGMILCDQEDADDIGYDLHYLPTAHIDYTNGLIVFDYVNNTKNPRGKITPPTAVLNVKPAPFMADFSSRGPNIITPEILKPDITAPGVDIIAAYSEASSPTEESFDHRTFPFASLSGTSMSCPHVSGVVGLLKTLHPDWSPAAIRSALMTTARVRDNRGRPMLDWDGSKATPFMYGSGHIRPNRAHDPGLVYDLTVNDYLDFLCGIGYNQSSISQFSASYYDCPNKYSALDFNNPSFSIPSLNRSVVVTRKVKNVGNPGTYVSRIRDPPGFSVSVEPKALKFETIGEEKTFKLTIKEERKSLREYQFGQLTWSDGHHYVRSPIVVASAGSST